ncbi:MAG: hypothetical protein QOJ41_1713 [Acidobacteriaceae bacterium]|jgi:hypothetical protein|nr:hypothetical protein [Acidobacteriaceae bacterium]
MTVFDVLFLLGSLISVVTLVVAAVFAVRGQRARALKLLRWYCICAAGYFAVAVAVAFLRPPHVMGVGDPWCFDDWCLAVEKVGRMDSPSQVSYHVDLRVFSRARRVTERANGAWIYLIDDRGRRYSADPSPSATPLDVLLRPLESASTQRVFHVPPDAHGLGVITGHGGPYCGPMNLLIIGSGGCLFNKPTMIRIE